MDILFIVPYVPNLIRVRPYNFIRSLTARGHRVTVRTLWTDDTELEDLSRLREEVHAVEAIPMPTWRSLANCIPALVSGDPLQSVYSWRPELVVGLNGRSPYDIVHVEHLRGVRYALHLKRHTHLPIVWDSVDCISHLFRQAAARSKSRFGRLWSWFELGRTERFESQILHDFDRILVTSRIDGDALEALNPNGRPAPITVLGNGVNLDYFRPNPAVQREAASLVVTGKMSYHANISMVTNLMEQIMPLVWAARPDVHVWVVGKDPGREVMAYGEHPQVTVTGTVPDLRSYLQRATISVAPLTYGAGVQNKILEAMACATPVVTTPLAVAALDVEENKHLLVGKDHRTVARHILSLLNDPIRRRQIGESGRCYLEQHHDWSLISGRLEQIYQQTIRQHATQSAIDYAIN